MSGVHVLHIGKTGGTALSTALAPLIRRGDVVFHGHDVALWDVPTGEKVVFCVRDPVSRFVSGFNSRLRKGRHQTIEWTMAERIAFVRFPAPGRLAAALRSTDVEERAAAEAAMNGIYHTARHLTFWLRSADYVRQRRDDILFICQTRQLSEDFEVLARILNVAGQTALPSDAVGRHATPDGFETTLDCNDDETVARWYAKDQPLYETCLEIRRTLLEDYRGVGRRQSLF